MAQGFCTNTACESFEPVAGTAWAAAAGTVASAAAAGSGSAAGVQAAAGTNSGWNNHSLLQTSRSLCRSQQQEKPCLIAQCWLAPRRQRTKGSTVPGRRTCEAILLQMNDAVVDLEYRKVTKKGNNNEQELWTLHSDSTEIRDQLGSPTKQLIIHETAFGLVLC